MANGFKYSISPIRPGRAVDIVVSDAPCQPVTVILRVNSKVIGMGDLGIGQGASYEVPAGCAGTQWELTIQCADGTMDTRSGLIDKS